MVTAAIILAVLFAVAFLVVFVVGALLVALAVKALPFLVGGWLVAKLVRRAEAHHRTSISDADRRWLDTRG